ncbi:MAG: hypothetical protein ACLR23_08645 [Clostridia bacterium]
MITVLWWGGSGIPFFAARDSGTIRKKKSGHVVGESYLECSADRRHGFRDRRRLSLYSGMLFYIDGVGTVIKMSTAYGATSPGVGFHGYGSVALLQWPRL